MLDNSPWKINFKKIFLDIAEKEIEMSLIYSRMAKKSNNQELYEASKYWYDHAQKLRN